MVGKGSRALAGTAARGALLALAIAVLGGCEADPRQARICAKVAEAFAEPGGHIDIVESMPSEEPEYDVRLNYRSIDRDGKAIDHSVWCGFVGKGLSTERFDLFAVGTSQSGRLTPMEMFWLRRVLGLEAVYRTTARTSAEKPVFPDSPDGIAFELLYFLQQTINAIALGAVYGLVAIAFTLVYGIIRKINFAFGEIYMIGAVGTVLWTLFFATIGAAGLAIALLATLALTVATAGLYGWASERLVFRSLRRVDSHAPLIAAIGLAIFLQEYMRLLHTARDFWLPPIFSHGVIVAEAEGFTVHASLKQGLVLVLVLASYAILTFVLQRTRFGRAQRACADDTGLAELMGVNVDRTVAGTFAIGGVCAGIGGFIIVEYYGVANFFMGLMLGFKALTAAIIGGIGSVSGAIWGAMLLAALEVYWSAYFAVAWKDVAAFGLLIMVLVFRPDGLLGVPKGRGD